MKKILFLIIFSFQILYSQEIDTLDIFTCIKSSVLNSPNYKQKDLYNDIYLLKRNNYNSKWLPNIDFNSDVSYQSDVISIEIDNLSNFINFPVSPNDHYNMSLDINQMIFDGGISKNMKTSEQILLKNKFNEIDIQLYKKDEKVESVYFSILLLEKSKIVIKETLTELKTRQKAIESGIKNGSLAPTDMNIIKYEIIKTELQLEKINIQRKNLVNVLSNLSNINISENTYFTLPDTSIIDIKNFTRPEKLLFSTQKESLENANKLLSSKKAPKLYAYTRLGYGKPALNLLNNQFDSYYIIGASLKWNIWDWNYTKREKQILAVKSKIIDTQEKDFNKNIDLAMEYNSSEKKQLKNEIEKQKKIIKITENIVKNSKSQLDNGLITTSDYILQINKDLAAKINLESNNIKLLNSQFELFHITGQLYNIISSQQNKQ